MGKWNPTDLFQHMMDIRKASYEKFFGGKSVLVEKNIEISNDYDGHTSNFVFDREVNKENFNTEIQDAEFRKNLISIHSLVDSMLVYDPRKRISAKKALKNPYFEAAYQSQNRILKCRRLWAIF